MLSRLNQALCSNLEIVFKRLEERLGGLDANLGELGTRLGEVESLKADVGGLEERLGGLDANLGELGSRLGEVESRKAESSSLLEQTGRLHETQRLLSRLKRDVVLQERRINLLLAEGRRRLPKRRKPTFPETLANEDRHRLDALYVSFEDEYRGTRDDIRERQRIYLPIVRKAGAGTSERPIVDVGCGRGEWLEVLKEEKLVGRGVDLNRVVVEQCRELGLQVECEDAFSYLRELPDGSLGAVTGFHIIEHLPFESALDLLDETMRVLKPNGVAIFETPNPDNVLVGSRNFYLDPTHRNPLPSSLLRFLAEQRGLVNVEVLNLHPAPEAFDADDGNRRLVEQLNAYFSGPQDYAVVGYKP